MINIVKASKIILYSSITIILLIILCSSNITVKRFYESNNNWKNIAFLDNIRVLSQNNKPSFMIYENEYLEDKDTELIIHFNDVKKNSFQYFGNYSKKDAMYIPNPENKVYGDASGNFSQTHHKINLTPTEESLFYWGKDLSSFSVDFWVYPQAVYEGNELFSYYGPAYMKETDSIEYSGFRCYIMNNQMMIRFNNIFRLNDMPISFEINTNVELELAQWQHIAISYNEYLGKLVVLKNNQKKAIVWITENSKEKGNILHPKIPELLRTQLLIGSNFFGNIDEFHIQKKFLEDFDLSKYKRNGGMILSKVIDTGFSTSSFVDFIPSGTIENNTKVYVFVRISEDMFDEFDTKFEWIQFKKNLVLKGRYLQWKLMLMPAFDAAYTPVVNEFMYHMIPNNLPAPPTDVSYELLDDGAVKIKWAKNLETDVIGYYVYYGNKSKFYINSDAKEGISPIYTVNNEIILHLNKFTEYYAAIKAVDNAFYPQRSLFSKEILFRTD